MERGTDDETGTISEEQIVGILQEQEAGAKTADILRKQGITATTFYRWKAKYGGLDVSEAKRLCDSRFGPRTRIEAGNWALIVARSAE